MRSGSWKIFIFVFPFVIILSNQTLAKEKNHIKRISNLTNWSDKYPSDYVFGSTFFNVHDFRNDLIRILRRGRWKKFLNFVNNSTQSPIRQLGDFLFISMCEAHKCGQHEFHIFVHLKKLDIIVCEQEMQLPELQDPAPIKLWATWYSLKGRLRVENQTCEDYDERFRDMNWLAGSVSFVWVNQK